MDDGHHFIHVSKKLRVGANLRPARRRKVAVTLCFGMSWRHCLPTGRGKAKDGFVTVPPSNRGVVTGGYRYALAAISKFFSREFPESEFMSRVKGGVPQNRKIEKGEIAKLHVGEKLDDDTLTVDIGQGTLTARQIKELPSRANATRLLSRADMYFRLDAATPR